MISIFTPSHKAKLLESAWDSLKDHGDFQWVVVLNGGARYYNPDPRVKVVTAPTSCGSRIGSLKKFAVENCDGGIFVELDHDDALLPGALDKIKCAASQSTNAFIFSDTLETKGDEPIVYGENFGWDHYDFCHEGKKYKINRAFEPSPRSMAEIFYSPNHVRAWTRKAYEAAGGYDASMAVCDDQDLVARTYLSGADFIHISEPIYWQHINGGNAQHSRNADIQRTQAVVRDKYIGRLALEWSRRNGLMALDFGGAHSCPEGFTPVDIHPVKGGIQCNLSSGILPFDSQSVGIIRCQDFLEHIPIGSVVPLMNEMHRVLAHNGILWTSTPSTDGRGAFCDPTHVSFWNELSFRYYTSRQFANYVPEIKCRFQKVSLETTYPSEWHKSQHLPYVNCVMAANHGGRMAGLTEI